MDLVVENWAEKLKLQPPFTMYRFQHYMRVHEAVLHAKSILWTPDVYGNKIAH